MAERTTAGRCFVYVLPCAYEDLLKVGFSRDPLSRIAAFHPRWFETFDLERGVLIETETVRDARALELRLHRRLALHNAPAPLIVDTSVGGGTEWFRGASDDLAQTAQVLRDDGFTVSSPLRGCTTRCWHAATCCSRGRSVCWTGSQILRIPSPADASCGRHATHSMRFRRSASRSPHTCRKSCCSGTALGQVPIREGLHPHEAMSGLGVIPRF